jgi:hypothetical protein
MQLMGDAEQSGNYAGQCLQISQQYGFSFWIYNSTYLHIWSSFRLETEESNEQRSEKILKMVSILEGFMAMGVRFGVLSMHVEVCLAFIDVDDLASAKDWVQRSWELLADCGEEYLRGDLHRIDGLIALREEDPIAAAKSFDKSKEVAQQNSNARLLKALDT